MNFLQVTTLKLCLFGLITFITLIILYSCSTEDEYKNKSGKTETIIQAKKTKQSVIQK